MNATIAGETLQERGTNRLGKSRAMLGTPGRAGVFAVVMGWMGCSSGEVPAVPVFPTTGRVVFEGRPAAGAFLTFHPKSDGGRTSPSTATAGTDGAFSLTTETKDDGAPAGEYAVTVTWSPPVKRGGELVAGPDLIPKRYGRVETTPLRATIAETANALEPFEIVKK